MFRFATSVESGRRLVTVVGADGVDVCCPLCCTGRGGSADEGAGVGLAELGAAVLHGDVFDSA